MSDIPIAQDQNGEAPGVCVHGPCTCESASELYCSEACRAADGADEKGSGDSAPCACGHDGCGTDAKSA